MKGFFSSIKQGLFREPYIPPPVTPLYIVWVVLVVGGGLATAGLSLSQYGSADTLRLPVSLALGLSISVLGVAEVLPVNFARLAGVLRLLSMVLVVMTFWLLVTSS